MLDKDEFAVAMYLVYKALDGETVPHILPSRLVPPSKRSLVRGSPNISPGVSPTPNMVSATVLHGSKEAPWVVTAAEKSKYDALFKTADKDNDNLVTGDEVKNIFMASGLPQPLLAHIWGLCDVNNTGRLNGEQFCLAMYLIHQKVKGIEPPQTLPPEMIPPSMRVAGQALVVPASSAIDDANKVSFGINMDAKIKQTVTNKLKEFLVEFRPVATFLQGDNSGEC
ncbi:epidermal growth factor receptor substrate 15-like 1 [Paramuricea clavata]|uniref:Epidermal growth factor receptor substrate 15-like 1 n=2 Tax=Paramuricea clavata TaxID=317549 RepID=A0A6S7JGJ2_PARCT|nr:epidermal growth factor receptor substrate 15-like 1 [Paramuricea clavata]